MPEVALPKWQCHKVVSGDQIIAINDLRTGDMQRDGAARIHLACGASITVDATWVDRHQARVGGYYVVYDDGYVSYSPQAAFEQGYTRIPEGKAALDFILPPTQEPL